MRSYTLPLKVCEPSGKRVVATITQMGDRVKIELPYIKEVDKDNPDFAKNGVVKVVVNRSVYAKTKDLVTNYLESVFLKELENADRNTGHGNRPPRRGNKKASSSGDTGKAEREESIPVRDRSRRGVAADDAGGGSENAEDSPLAESGCEENC